jgi:hypothetical protein
VNSPRPLPKNALPEHEFQSFTRVRDRSDLRSASAEVMRKSPRTGKLA